MFSCQTITSFGDTPSKVNTAESKCISSHSHVIVDTLSLEEQIPLVGVPFYLNYSSERFRSGFSFSPKLLGLGGWYPSIVHRYDVDKKILYYGYGGRRPVEMALFPSGFYVSDDSGDNIFYFDSTGKHLKTKDALTGAILYEFVYDNANRIIQIKDRFSNITSFNYQANKITLTSPYNENSELILNSNGMLVSLTNPNSEVYEVTYNSNNQLASFQKPMGQKSIVSYDGNGFVVKDQGAGGDFINLIKAASSTVDNQNISLNSSMGKVTNYTTIATDAKTDRTTTQSYGELETFQSVRNGPLKLTNSLGENQITTRAADPRFGWMASYNQSENFRIDNSSIDVKISTSKSVDIQNSTDPINFSSITTTTTLQNDPSKVYVSTFNSSSKTLTEKSPMNSIKEVKFNDQGVVSSIKHSSLEPVLLEYDNRGNIKQVTQGSKIIKFQYDSVGNMSTYTDVIGRSTSYEYDNSKRLVKTVLPDGNFIRMTYDKNGNLISLTPAGKPVHQFSYNLMELVSGYLPPAINAQALGQETYEYNLDKQMTKLNKPTGEYLSFDYHPTNGLLTNISSSKESLSLVYVANSSLIKNLNHSSGLNLEYSYVGKILKSVKTSGLVNHQVSFNFNPDASVSEVQVSGSDNVVSSTLLNYDNDGLLIKAGNLNYVRNDFGAISATSIGNLQSTNSFNNFGELTSSQSKYKNQILADFKYSRDKFARVSLVNESLRGINGWLTNTKNQYEYDKLGRLVKAINNSRATIYQYDGNGNRIKKSSFGENITADYDEQDRLIRYGNVYYTYNASGELILKTEKRRVHFFKTIEKKTQYFYDSFGNLSKVILPSQKVIEYLIDGQGRRVGKKVDGVLAESYIYQSQTQIIAVTDSTGVITKRFVYGEKQNSPDVLIMNNKEYRIISDQVGTPRQVVDLSNGRVKEELNFDEFGDDPDIEGRKVLPFGFAGGLYDRDTKLVHFGEREYMPEVGRWISKDKIGFRGGDANLYGYVLNDPVNLIDPEGLKFKYSTEEARKIFAPLIEEIRKGSMAGLDLITALESSNEVYTITIGYKSSQAATLLGSKQVIINPYSGQKSILTDDFNNLLKIPSLTRVLAHELGHLRSPGKSEIDNVISWENATMCPIEGYKRIKY